MEARCGLKSSPQAAPKLRMMHFRPAGERLALSPLGCLRKAPQRVLVVERPAGALEGGGGAGGSGGGGLAAAPPRSPDGSRTTARDAILRAVRPEGAAPAAGARCAWCTRAVARVSQRAAPRALCTALLLGVAIVLVGRNSRWRLRWK